MTNKIIIAIIASAIVILAAGYFWYFFFKGTFQKIQPASFEECVAAGYPIAESYPRQCFTPDGKGFVEIIKQPVQQPFPPSSDATVPESTVEKENVVIYADSGYSPAVLKIKKGEMVVFKNQSSKAMRPASAMHPTHRVYPTTGGCLGSTFDACVGIQPGKTWSFKFDILGTWKYHDHLNPGATGAIAVE